MRRRKLRKNRTDNTVTSSTTPPPLVTDALLIDVTGKILIYGLQLEQYKKEYFGEESLLKIYFRSNRDSLFIDHMEEYLEKSLSYTYKELGPVDEPILQWILSETPVSPLIFSLMRYKYYNYLKQQ